jgi:hypothetical protein
MKDVIPGWEMTKTPEWIKTVGQGISEGLAFLGHNRKKTIGENKEESAHPFIVDGRYIFFHNGTLTNWKQLIKDHPNPLSIEVDSEALALRLAPLNGDVDAIAELMQDVWGAYACMWFDTLDLKLHILKNDQRPLWYGETPFGYGLASEPNILITCLGRNQTTIKNLVEFKKGILYTLDLATTGSVFQEEELPTKKARPPIKGATPYQVLVTKTTTVCDPNKEPVSKNAFKQLRKKYMSKKLTFWMDDFTEKSINGRVEDCKEWIILGTSQLMEERHTIKGEVKGIDMNEIMYKWDGSLLQGLVIDMTYRKEDSSVEFTIGFIRSIPQTVTQ